MIKTAFLPSAGLGKRLRPMTNRIPKPLLPIQGEPLLVHVMRHCATAGIERFVLNTHHLPKSFEIAFPSGEWNGHPVQFVHEPNRLETGTGLKNLYRELSLEEPLLIYNSDILADFSLDQLFDAHAKGGSPVATLAASSRGPQLHLSADSTGYLKGVHRGPEMKGENRLQFLGISVVQPEILNFISEKEPESIVHSWIRSIKKDPHSVRIETVTEGRWIDAGSLTQYKAIKEAGLDGDGVLKLGADEVG